MVAEIKQFVLEKDDPAPESSRAESMMLFALKGLSQRAIAAVKDLFTLLSVASAFWLFLSIPDPNNYQLAELLLYALFVLAANWIVRRR